MALMTHEAPPTSLRKLCRLSGLGPVASSAPWMTGERQAQARFNRGTLTFWRFRSDWADRLEAVRRTRTPRQPSDCQEIDLPYWLGRDRVRARAEPIGVWAMKSSFSSWIRIFSVGA